MMQVSDQSPRSSGPAQWHVHVLVVEDDVAIQKMLRLALEKIGHRVSTAGDGATAIEIIRNDSIELVLLDIVLPEVDGFEVCRRIRTFSEVPVLMVTALNRTEDIVRGFEVGADDYITKPFSQRLLVARIRAILRRSELVRSEPSQAEQSSLPEPIVRGRLQMDPARHIVLWDGEAVSLTVSEFLILEALALRPGVVKSRNQLMDAAYSEDVFVDDRTIDSHIKRLRRKFRAVDPEFSAIDTLYGAGYSFAEG